MRSLFSLAGVFFLPLVCLFVCLFGCSFVKSSPCFLLVRNATEEKRRERKKKADIKSRARRGGFLAVAWGHTHTHLHTHALHPIPPAHILHRRRYFTSLGQRIRGAVITLFLFFHFWGGPLGVVAVVYGAHAGLWSLFGVISEDYCCLVWRRRWWLCWWRWLWWWCV